MVDLHAQAPVWRLSAEGAARLRGAAPAGWEVCIISADTVSDGDGGATPHDEVLAKAKAHYPAAKNAESGTRKAEG